MRHYERIQDHIFRLLATDQVPRFIRSPKMTELMAAAAPVSGPASVDEDEDADDLGEADFDAAIAEQAPSDDAELDDDDEPQRPAKEPRMTTSKVRARFSQLPLTLQRKATNFFTTANVKNKSRRGKPTPVAGESKPSVKASGRAKKGRR